MNSITDRYPEPHNSIVRFQLLVILLPITGIFTFTVIVALLLETSGYFEPLWIAQIMLSGIHLCLVWLVTLRTLKGPHVVANSSGVLWLLALVANLAIVIAFLYQVIFPKSDNREIYELISNVVYLGLPLVLLVSQCLYLRQRKLV